MANNTDNIEYKFYNTDLEIEEATQLLNISQEQQQAWNTKYDEAKYVANHFRLLGKESKAKRISECGSIVVATNLGTGEVTHYRNRCNTRMCPICTWRKGLKIADEMKAIVNNISTNNNYKWITVTLTTKNVKGADLQQEIEALNKGLTKLLSYAKVKKVVKGTFSALEITYNAKTNEYHPHFHLMVAVMPSYFKKAEYRIKNNEWVDLWKKAMNLNYTPTVKVKAVDNTNNLIDELSKFIYYIVKGIFNNLSNMKYDIFNAVIDRLDDSLSYKRLFRYTGVIATVKATIN